MNVYYSRYCAMDHSISFSQSSGSLVLCSVAWNLMLMDWLFNKPRDRLWLSHCGLKMESRFRIDTCPSGNKILNLSWWKMPKYSICCQVDFLPIQVEVSYHFLSIDLCCRLVGYSEISVARLNLISGNLCSGDHIGPLFLLLWPLC